MIAKKYALIAKKYKKTPAAGKQGCNQKNIGKQGFNGNAKDMIAYKAGEVTLS
ncbi:MAG: hypothetical protein ACI9NY_001124 [Kiritimatiellia bacterium]|jgi:hypothetical protein